MNGAFSVHWHSRDGIRIAGLKPFEHGGGSMVHSTLTHSLLAACSLVWSAAACSSKHLNSPPQDAAGLDARLDPAANAGPQCSAAHQTHSPALLPNTILS